MCQLDEMIEPSEKLRKMLSILKFIFAINLIVLMIHLFKFNNNIFMEVMTSIFLLMTFYSINFVCCGLYIFFSLYNVVYLFINIGTFFQVAYMGAQQKITNDDYMSLGLDTFYLCFQVFSIYATFPVYKEMKAQYTEVMGMADNGVEADEYQENDNFNNNNFENNVNANNNNNNNNNQPRGYQPFAGRGVAVGGN